MMKKICLIFTGGTIGSVVKDGWISTDDTTKYNLIEQYREVTGDNKTEFEICAPYTVHSENLSAGELNRLLSCVLDALSGDYEGIIVTHGTDTLQYSAAALSFAFSDCKVPVVLVSADYPLSDERSNGVSNFCGAVRFIREKMGSGVCVSYKNDDEDTVRFHSGVRLARHAEASGNLYSIDKMPYASGSAGKGLGAVTFRENADVLVVRSCPGESYAYDLDRYGAVILEPYHSGTLNTADEKLKTFCDTAKEKKIPAFVVNVKGGTSYESCKAFEELGVEVLPFCSTIAIFMKCWLGLSLQKKLKEFVLTPIADEF